MRTWEEKARQPVLEDTTLRNVVHSFRIKLNTLFYQDQNRQEKSMPKRKFLYICNIYLIKKSSIKYTRERYKQLFQNKIKYCVVIKKCFFTLLITISVQTKCVARNNFLCFIFFIVYKRAISVIRGFIVIIRTSVFEARTC